LFLDLTKLRKDREETYQYVKIIQKAYAYFTKELKELNDKAGY